MKLCRVLLLLALAGCGSNNPLSSPKSPAGVNPPHQPDSLISSKCSELCVTIATQMTGCHQAPLGFFLDSLAQCRHNMATCKTSDEQCDADNTAYKNLSCEDFISAMHTIYDDTQLNEGVCL